LPSIVIAAESLGIETGRAFSAGTTTFPPLDSSALAVFALGDVDVVAVPFVA